MFRCVGALSSIVPDEPGLEIAGYTAVMQLIIRFADEYVNIMEAFHRTVAFGETIMGEESWPAKP